MPPIMDSLELNPIHLRYLIRDCRNNHPISSHGQPEIQHRKDFQTLHNDHANTMSKAKRSTIEVQQTSIAILSQPQGDYISRTDMVRNFDGAGALIEQWFKNKDAVLFRGVWERINKPCFNSIEFEGIRKLIPNAT